MTTTTTDNPHLGRVLISIELLDSVLNLPKGTKIKRVSNGDAWRGAIELVVEHPDLPEVPEGHTIPSARYTVETKSEWEAFDVQ